MDYDFKGKKLEDAIEECKRMEIPYRITLLDGISQAVERGIDVDRYNFEVENNIITWTYFG
jgi:hypothetical protein